MKILTTGTAGFIGAHTARQLLDQNIQVIGIDNINDYYDTSLKHARIDWINEHENAANFSFIKMDIADRAAMEALFAEHKFDRVIHLAAQAGVRYSIENPHAYIDANILGFMNILEGCRHHKVEHLVYASSSSVYGANEAMPFSVDDNVDHPVSLYAASKKANELMAHTYSHLYGLPTTGLRFFTVYGPWGRPDMAPFKFTKAISEGRAIDVYNYGNHRRDFTYIDDIVQGVIAATMHIAQPNADWDGKTPSPSSSKAPWRVYNIGAQTPVHLLTFIETIEKALGKTAEKNMLPMQPGDVEATFADVEALVNDVGYRPSVSLDEGIKAFVDWYKDFYGEA
ncbi:NAD-dependent epimerase [Glaciecola sp. KUL10]|uniref:NAD-dependent epimerase n=1 Tax=Glaciecola sp. (strain KUL10) TaxID=2161813 RepID=UPI000D7884E4|nr:NAD-dependent epimerase [Glaciecola sp. KUL10]GBL04847.1 UDP-glucuronate 5'-epimerase [Glaciecola sp. KUL10]